ncbi:hypothetical protein IAR55_002474 [Kwoniella newhampshirensis]|uniref:Myb-like domain-containing protein n=1 Tax=Kwoniella newhampshirensis TaxID=1651941 RepID=A0AAW0Z1L5_9TREE
MPPTRASVEAGPSRIPVYQNAHRRTLPHRRLTRQTISQQFEARDEPSGRDRSSSAAPGGYAHSTRERSISFGPLQTDKDATPQPRTRTRMSRHKRNASHQSIHLSPPVRSKPLIRKSLTGSAVLGMTINDRAEILADVAGDCLVTLVRSIHEERPRTGKSGDQDDARKAWDGLYALRQSYIFPPYSPPFPLPTDIIESLHSQVRSSVDPSGLVRAVQLSNLATFIWTILRPDEAGSIMSALDIDDGEDESVAERLTRSKGKWKAKEVDDELVRKVRRRNLILLSAWKKFWLVVVPRNKRTSESALRIWLDLATQVQLLYQCSTTRPTPQLDTSLPRPPSSQIRDLFSPSAVGRYGQWEISEDYDSLDFDQDKMNIEERWNTLAKRRLNELNSVPPEILIRKYPYDIFRQEIMGYIQHDVLGSPTAILLTPGRRRLLIGSAAVAMSSSEPSEESDLAGDDADATSQSEAQHGEGDSRTASPIDFDLLAEIANELDGEQNFPITTDLAGQGDIDGHEWAIKDYVPPRGQEQATPSGRLLANADGALIEAQRAPPRFKWAAKQEDAVQVDWESLSIDGNDSAPQLAIEQTKDDQSESLSQAKTSEQPVPSNVERSNASLRGVSPPIRVARTSHLNSRTTDTPVPYRSNPASAPQNSRSPFQSRSMSVDDEPELHEEERTPEMSGDEEDIADLLPDMNMAQLSARVARTSSNELQTPYEKDEEEDFADLLPDGNILSAGGLLVPPIFPIEAGIDMDAPQQTDNPGNVEPAQTSSQAAYISSRPRKSLEAHQFTLPDEEEDQDDRKLLQHIQRVRALDRQPSVKLEGLPREGEASSQPSRLPLFPRGGRAQVSLLRDDEDPFLVDEDGSSLEPDPLFIIPVDYKPVKSQIHGKLDNTRSTYCRLTGKRKWTKEEELLLYRTVQKVPMHEEYPLRVACALHGEYGSISTTLKWYNAQHMKDKMRVVVSSRLSKGRPVVGRARFWLPKDSQGRREYEQEMAELKREREPSPEVEVETEDDEPDGAASHDERGGGSGQDEEEERDSDSDHDQEEAMEQFIDDDFPEAVIVSSSCKVVREDCNADETQFDIDVDGRSHQSSPPHKPGTGRKTRKTRSTHFHLEAVDESVRPATTAAASAQARADRAAKRKNRNQLATEAPKKAGKRTPTKRARRKSEVVVEIVAAPRPTEQAELETEPATEQELIMRPSHRRQKPKSRKAPTKSKKSVKGVAAQKARKTAQPIANQFPEPETGDVPEADMESESDDMPEDGPVAPDTMEVNGSAGQATQYEDEVDDTAAQQGSPDAEEKQRRAEILKQVLSGP